MTLSSFNQEGGKVTGNIQNLTIESKQNTSTTKGSTTGESLSIAPNGLPSGSAVGGHSLLGGDVRKASNSSITNYSNGVYEMMIELKDANGNWIPKSVPTTMYPVTWSEGRIKYEVSEAFNNWRKETQNLNTNVTGKWSGVSPSGVTIEGFVQNDYIKTAYPQRPVSTP